MGGRWGGVLRHDRGHFKANRLARRPQTDRLACARLAEPVPHRHHLVPAHRPHRDSLEPAAEHGEQGGCPLSQKLLALISVSTYYDFGWLGLLAAVYAVFFLVFGYDCASISAQDRARYFAALHTMYVVDMDTGGRRYGPHYRSAAWLVREHLYGAAQQDCDHWHDDAGFVNHHVGVTWQFEQSLQAIDPRVSAHYWDYTIDAASNSSYAQSLIFSEDWFGPASPQQEDHVVNIGRWAFTPVLQDARKFSAITNPYGLLRSPWNTNPVPYLTRYSQVLGSQNDGYSLTTCEDFSAALSEYNWIGDFFAKLDGKLHGPVHIMIGGHWDVDTQTASWLGSGMGEAVRHRALIARALAWR